MSVCTHGCLVSCAAPYGLVCCGCCCVVFCLRGVVVMGCYDIVCTCPPSPSLPTRRLEAMVAPNEGGFLIGAWTTYGDIALFSFLDFLLGLNPEALLDYGALSALKYRVAAIPPIAAYLATRPPQ